MPKRRPRRHLFYKYELCGSATYEEKFLLGVTTENPFEAYYKLAEMPVGCLLTHIGRFYKGRIDYNITEERHKRRGNLMMIQDDDPMYATAILFTEDANEFQRINKPFVLWEVRYNKFTDFIADFTMKSDNVQILSMFANRLDMRLEKGPTRVDEDKKHINLMRAQFALVWQSEKDLFIQGSI